MAASPASSRSWLSEAPALHAHRERLRRDLEIERPAIARRGSRRSAACASVMTRVKMSRRPVVLLGFERPAHVARQRQRLQQRHQVHRAALQRGARRPATAGRSRGRCRSRSVAQPGLHRLAKRQEARAELVGDRAQAKVEAGRLELRVVERRRRRDPARARPRRAARDPAGRRRRTPRVARGASRRACASTRGHARGSPHPRCRPSSALRRARRCRPRASAASIARATASAVAGDGGQQRRPGARSARSRAPRPARAASATAGIHGKERQAIGLVQPVVERGRRARRARPACRRGQQQRDALHVEDGVRARDACGQHGARLGRGAGHLGHEHDPAQRSRAPAARARSRGRRPSRTTR